MKTIILLFSLSLPFIAMAQDREYHLDEKYNIKDGGNIYVLVDWRLSNSGIVRGDKEFRVEVNERSGDLHIRQQEEGDLSMIGSTREE